MADDTKERECQCGSPQRWSASPEFPVEFDSQMNEFHLVHNGMQAVMRYCFWCGGRLPESKRSTFFTEPSESEQQEVLRLLKGAKSSDDVRRALGEPDESFHGMGNCKWTQQLRYSRRWKTLVLDVQEMRDGSIQYGIAGQFIGDRQA